MKKSTKEKLKRELKIMGIGTAAMTGGSVARKGLGRLADRPSGRASDKALAEKLLGVAERRGIEVRRGKRNFGDTFKYPKAEVEKIRNAALIGDKIPVMTPEGKRNLHELVDRKIVWMKGNPTESPAQLAHEIGHIPSGRKSVRWKYLTHNLPLASQAVGPLYSMIASRKAKTPEKARRAGTIGALISLIGSAPMLAHEALPSIKGMRTMRQQGASRGQVARLGASRLLPSLGAYTMMAAAPALAAVLISRAVAKNKKKDKKK